MAFIIFYEADRIAKRNMGERFPGGVIWYDSYRCVLCYVLVQSCSARKSMETRSQQDEERANILEVQVDEAKVIAEEADRKYEEVKQMPVVCWAVASYSFFPLPSTLRFKIWEKIIEYSITEFTPALGHEEFLIAEMAKSKKRSVRFYATVFCEWLNYGVA